MAYGDTCGKWKMCFPKDNCSGCDCSACAEFTIGKRLELTFTGGNTIEYIFGDTNSRVALTGTAYSGVMEDLFVINGGGSDKGGYWDNTGAPYDAITNDQFFPSTIYENLIDPTFNEYEAYICFVRTTLFKCNQNSLIFWEINIGSARTSPYVGSGNYSTDYTTWNYIVNVTYNLGFGGSNIDFLNGPPGGNCDHDYQSSPVPGAKWVISSEGVTINPTTSWS